MSLIGPWINQWLLDTDTNEWVGEGVEPSADNMTALNRIVIRIPVASIQRAPLTEPPPMDPPAEDPPAAEPEPEDPFPLPDIETTD
ncbi:hypothetical protein AB0I95_14905 [Micromonospora sp. NPDC049751]|uniref:hypothetical protein n=1 Tax=Micromonospora sp. NPDC049751 TaxID=3154837 RepID=UPI003408C663